MKIETKIKEDATTGLSAGTVTDVDVTGFSFTPTAVLDCSIYVWNTANNEFDMNLDNIVHTHSLYGGAPTRAYNNFAGIEYLHTIIVKATPGTNKVTVRVANYGTVKKYRITCTAARSA